MDELRRVAPTSPTGQKRILSIDHPLVYRIRVSSERGATWLDEPRSIVTALQNRTPVDMVGIEVDERRLTVAGRTIALYVVRPKGATNSVPAFMFFHGAVWIAGNFENHKRLVRDLVVGSGAVAVFPEYTPVPVARYRVQIEQAHAAGLSYHRQ